MTSSNCWTPLPDDHFIPDNVHVVVEDPDGNTFTQLIPNSFESLQEYKETLGNDYWIVDIY